MGWSGSCFEIGADEFRRDLGIDCIAETPQESHAAGYPISQRLKSGFNTADFRVPAVDEFEVGPEVSAACRGN